MVRKRSKGARRHYESEEEAETESDFDDDPAYEPAPKKYSLRQRKKPTFISDDWEYEEDAPAAAPKPPSDDDEFKVQKDDDTKVDEAADSKNVEDSTEGNTTEPTATTTGKTAPAEQDDELVDFEDMIRADIVVNKNRIDYDNIIQKTEIKLQPLPEGEQVKTPWRKAGRPPGPPKPKGKRGRKPKRRNSTIEEPQYFAPQIQEDENDEDYHPYKPKRTRKPKKRPAGEIDSSLLDDFDNEDDKEDRNDADYNPEDDLDYPDISNYILNRQISDYDDDSTHIIPPKEDIITTKAAEPNSSIDVVTADTTDSVTKADSNSISTDTETTSVTETQSLIEAPSECATDSNAATVSNSGDVSEETTSDLKSVSVPSADVADADTTSNAVVPDTTEVVEPSDNAVKDVQAEAVEDVQAEAVVEDVQAEAVEDVQAEAVESTEDVPVQSQEINESEKSSSSEKVTSTSHESVIKVNENCVTSDVQVNGSVKHIEAPQTDAVNNEVDEDEDDDDIVFVEEDKKYEIIVLDD